MRAGRSKLELAAMAGALGAAARSRAMAAVAVKPAAVLATSPYGNDQMREREVGDATVVAGHGQARSSAALCGHGGDNDTQCGFTLARMVALAGREGGVAHGGAMGEVDWVVVLRGRQALPTELDGNDGVVPFCFGAYERAKER